MIAIKIEVERKFDYKEFLPTEEELKRILQRVGDEFIELFKTNVEQQRTWMKDNVDKNSAFWSAYKSAMGYDLRSLVMKDKSFIDLKNWTIVINQNKIAMKMNHDLRYKFYEVLKLGEEIGKNYGEVMPDLDIEAELDWFDNRFDVLMNELVDKKSRY